MTANRYTIARHISSIAPVVKVLDGHDGLVLNAGGWFMVSSFWFMVTLALVFKGLAQENEPISETPMGGIVIPSNH